MKSQEGRKHPTDWYDKMGEVALELESSYLLYPIAERLKGEDRLETATNLVRWVKSNIFHAYQNKSGISKWFTKAERYTPPGGYPFFVLRST